MQTKKFFKYFSIAILLLVGGFLVAGQIAYFSIEKIDPPGEMYHVNGSEIHMYCTGPENDARPTIIIISGGGTPSYVYDQLRENLSETIRTCSYDIAGFGWSEPNNFPLTVKNMSNELHLLLQAAQIDGDIVLAGHSMGGLVSLIYSADHKEQVAGIAFIDSSHYNQVGYFGDEFRKISDRQTEEFLANFWLVELGSRLGIMNLMDMIFSSSYSEQHRKDHEMSASLHRWNPPYAGMKSVISNFKLSLEQAKESHYDREDLPIISLSASNFPLGGEGLEEFSKQELIDAKRFIHQDLADLSNNGKHVIVNGTSHMSILHHDETAKHILSIVPEINAVSFQSITYDYEDICKFPVTDEMRLALIEEASHDFTNDGLSFIKLRGGTFTHIELSQHHEHLYPSLEYWYTLKNGQQVYFEIGACDEDTSRVSLGKISEEYYLIKPDTGETQYRQISVPGFPLVNTVTMQPVLDDANCYNVAEYYTKLQSPTMFTRENVTFDPLWKEQVFPLMDYCDDTGDFKMNVVDEKLKWDFVISSLHDNTVIEKYKDLSEVVAFYAKYPDADEEVRSDHVSYFAGSDDGFKVRMNLYFDENHDLDYMNLKCYLNRELQTDVPENFISKYLEDFTCNEYGSQRNEN